MKQLLQRLDNGRTEILDVPVPSARGTNVLVQTHASLISAGTERMLVDFGRSNLLQKVRSQPDKVRQVVDKMRTDGLQDTLEAVRSKLGAPIPLGYCSAGVVEEVGNHVEGLAVGDRVITNGPHSEYVTVPHTLAARIPDGVSFQEAAFVPVAAIGLQGIRLAEPTLGETVVVQGLGLIGLLTVQLLRANGCRVIGVDVNPGRLSLADSFGAEVIDARTDVVSSVMSMTDGVGADAVLMTLASSSDEPVHQAAEMSRKKGRIVLVGVTGLNLRRDDFYKKELSFAVSCSYGPGRYDPVYEEGGQDYPLPYVRWTEKRNFEAVLGLMARGQLNVEPLISHRFAFDEAPKAYDLITSEEPSLGVLLEYAYGEADRTSERSSRSIRTGSGTTSRPGPGSVGFIGAGNFAVRTLLPSLAKTDARLHTIASGGGTSAAIAARTFKFENATTDLDSIIANPEIDTVFVLTRHDTHAGLVLRALESGKHVFVEKPLALNEPDVERIARAAEEAGRHVLVGFNRRFAPLANQARTALKGRSGPATIIATINAGAIPRDHWTQDPDVGGGRIVGEACHWIDLARSLVEAPISSVHVQPAHDQRGMTIDDIAHISVGFVDGSTAAIHYLANGSNSFPKERIECFFDGKTLVIDNWRRLQRFGVPGSMLSRKSRINKGHEEEMRLWMNAITSGGAAPIPLDEIVEVSTWAIRAAEQARGRA